MKRLLLTFLVIHLAQKLLAQEHFTNVSLPEDDVVFPTEESSEDSVHKNNGRKWLVAGASTAVLAGSLVYLTRISNYTYYKGFKTRNDNKAWQQMDKCTHAYVAYSSARLLNETYEWAGFSKPRSVLISSATVVAYTSVKEFFDAHQRTGGWSWGDVGANTFGTALFAAQELGWEEQRIQFKISAFPRNYPDDLEPRTDEIYGTNVPKKLIKDYNAQTYWFSFNLNSFAKKSKIPEWLNLAVGYGADGMLGSYDNKNYQNGVLVFDRSDIKRYRQFYISPDIDLTKIPTKNKWLKTLFVVANSVKVPLPAIEFSNNKIKGRIIQF